MKYKIKYQSMENINKIVSILNSFGCDEIYIFGSYVEGRHDINSDIDIAVRGLNPSVFFKAYSLILGGVDIQVDLIDLDDNTKFSKMILASGDLERVK